MSITCLHPQHWHWPVVTEDRGCQSLVWAPGTVLCFVGRCSWKEFGCCWLEPGTAQGEAVGASSAFASGRLRVYK